MSSSSSSSESSGSHSTSYTKIKGITPVTSIPDAKNRNIGIVHTQWNTEIITALVNGAIEELQRQGVPSTSIHVLSVCSDTDRQANRCMV